MAHPQCVQEVLAFPGKYCFFLGSIGFLFEVDERGQVHQLTPDTLARDGILSPDCWVESEMTRGEVCPVVEIEVSSDEPFYH